MTYEKTSRRLVWRGELAAALLTGDAATVEFVARNLGLISVEPSVAVPTLPHEDVTSVAITDQTPEPVDDQSVGYPDNLEASQFWRAFRYETRADVKLPESEEPRWGWRNPPQEQPRFRPISSKSLVHPRLRMALSSLSRGHGLDVPKVVRTLANAEPLGEFPRERLRRWGRRILVVLDQSDRLVPFFDDQKQLCHQLEAVTPDGAITELFCRDPDDEFVFIDSADFLATWTFSMPARIVVLSDLGVLQRGDNGHLQQRWIQWGRKLVDRGFSIVALVPFPVEVANSPLRRTFQLVPWQRSAHHYVQEESRRSELVNELLVAASPVVRLEPGLLRSLRLLIPGARDASLESDVWQHPIVTNRHVDAASLDRRAMEERYCPAFAKLPSDQRSALLTTIRSWRFGFSESPEVWFQEILNLDPDSQRIIDMLFPGDLQDAIAGIHHLAALAKKKDQTNFSRRLREYGGRTVDWFSAATWSDSRIRQAVHDLWNASPIKRYSDKAGLDPGLFPSGDPTRFYLGQRGGAFEFAMRQRSAASPITSVTTGNRLINMTPALMKKPYWKSGSPPQWASDWGRDNYGAWVEFTIDAATEESVSSAPTITQRMRWIRSGKFLMGSPEEGPENDIGRYSDEGPQHEVRLTRGFWIFDTAVTQELWQAVMGDNPSEFKEYRSPVDTVSWDDAQRFLERLNTRLGEAIFVLPTEAQWEHACRAGTQTAYSFGDDPKMLDDYAWYAENSESTTHPVATKKCNTWGLFDMHGNVWEWCQDFWSGNYSAAGNVDPPGPEKGHYRVLRGGSWSRYAQSARSAYRNYYDPGYRGNYVGFRCAQVQAVAEPTEEDGEAAEQQACPTKGGVAVELPVSSVEIFSQIPIPASPILIVRSDMETLELHKFSKPEWASAIGRDRFGLWAEFTFNADVAVQQQLKSGTSSSKRKKTKVEPTPATTQLSVVQRMRWIPPGRFWMGSSESDDLASGDEKPQHEVILSHGYWLFDTPVTQELWLAVMKTNPSHFSDESNGRRPVETVTWDDCRSFIDKINQSDVGEAGLKLTLPTEAEWEYACRAGTTTRYSFGDEISLEQANYWREGAKTNETTEVGDYPANPWGLYDMHGNVWEWCFDWYDGQYYAASGVVNPVGPEKGLLRVLRGGSWNNDAQDARSAYRDIDVPGSRISNVGFRCAQVHSSIGAVREETERVNERTDEQGADATPPDRSE